LSARFAIVLLAVAIVLAVGCEAEPEAGEARARAMRIASDDQLIGGPKALGQVGDYLLENDRIRVIIHGPGPGRASLLFGGSILDADLQRPEGTSGRGRDQLVEITPAFVLEGFEPTRFEVASDGTAGGPAIVRVEGRGGEFLQLASILSTGLLFPAALRFRIDYILEPGAPYLAIDTSLINESGQAHPLPFLSPGELADLGLDVPGITDLELSTPLGHLLLFGKENDVFAPGVAGFDVRFSIERSYASAQGFPAFPGLVAPFLATRGRGVSYGLMAPESPDNYVGRYAQLYDDQAPTDGSLLLPFQFSSVLAAYHSAPPRVLEPGETFTYRAYLIVGRGDVGSIADVVYELRGTETGRFAGRVIDARSHAPVAGASVVVSSPGGVFFTQLDTDASGDFLGSLPPGAYEYRVVAKGRRPSPPAPFRIERGETSSVIAELPSPATLAVQVTDELGRPAPAKVTLVGRFAEAHLGDDPREFLYDLALGESMRPTALDPLSNEYIEAIAYTDRGAASLEIIPGAYDLVVSRGVEYHVHREPIELWAGQGEVRHVQLERAVDTRGYLSADLHMHAQNSPDAAIEHLERVRSIAGEGVEFVAATDHNHVTDYEPAIVATGLENWLSSCVGVEVTTFELGHFNGYPLRLDPGSSRGGEIVWAGETADSIFSQIRAHGLYGPDHTIVQVNHPRSGPLGYFDAFHLDQDTAEPGIAAGLRGVFSPHGDEFHPDNFSYEFDVIEVLNGKRLDELRTYRAPDPLPPPPLPDPPPEPGEIVRDGFGRPAFPGALDDWFTLLNRGARYTAVGASDSHGTLGQEPGYPRTYVYLGARADAPGTVTPRDVVDGLRSGRAFFTNGPIVKLWVEGVPMGGEVVAAEDRVTVELRVTSANFSPFDRVRLWSNGELVADLEVPPDRRHHFETTIELPLERDRWVVAEVTGSESLFPIVPPLEFEPLDAEQVIEALGASIDLSALQPTGNLRPPRTYPVTPVAITNPIWIDREGDGFNSPLPPLGQRIGPTDPARGDLRDALGAPSGGAP
jgi:hypothetical protein